tara:strand:- start:6207 stop:6656 length:450 start_codon:yes stop_codon:yes gene_type:complete
MKLPTQVELTDLRTKQRNYVMARLSGLDYGAAKKKAGYSNHTQRVEIETEEVMALIKKYMEMDMEQVLLTRDSKRRMLYQICMDEDEPTSNKIKAIEVDNIMTGENSPQKVELFGLTELLQLVRSKSKTKNVTPLNGQSNERNLPAGSN